MSRYLVGVCLAVVALVALDSSAALADAPSISAVSPTTTFPYGHVMITGTGFVGVLSVQIGGSAAGFEVHSATQIEAIVPPKAVTSRIRVGTSGGAAFSPGVVTIIHPVAPRLVSFWPVSGLAGTSVKLTGSGFTGTTAVRFGGQSASFSVDSATQITAVVPTGAVTGNVLVRNAAGVAESISQFTIQPIAISSFSPATAGVGTKVVIRGSGLSQAEYVRFGGITASDVTSDSDSQITAVVPFGAQSGSLDVWSLGGVLTTAATPFTVIPTFARSFTPAYGNWGDTIAISGEHLDAVTAVRFTTISGLTTKDFTVSPDGLSLSVRVPRGALSGPISLVTADGETVANGGPYHQIPQLKSVMPVTYGQTNPATGTATYALYGQGLAEVYDVTFNGVPASWRRISDLDIEATIPPGMKSGRFTLLVNPLDGQSLVSRPVSAIGPSVLVILAAPSGVRDSATQAAVQQLFAKDIDTWFAQASYGRFQLADPTAVTPWLSVPALNGCDRWGVVTNARAAATAAGFTPSDYDRVIVYSPKNGACEFAGSARGNSIRLNGDLTVDTVVHELGHTLGLGHAGLLSCTDAAGAPVTESANCTTDVYGDDYSAMGDGSGLSAVQSAYLGWLNGRVTNVQNAGWYRLDPLEQSTVGQQALRIAVDNKIYWLEYRRPVGIDAFLSQQPACDWSGVQVRETTADSPQTSVLLGFGPNVTCKSLAANQSWTDPTGTLTITPDALSDPSTGIGVTIRLLR